jgi:hypothetical protein
MGSRFNLLKKFIHCVFSCFSVTRFHPKNYTRVVVGPEFTNVQLITLLFDNPECFNFVSYCDGRAVDLEFYQ